MGMGRIWRWSGVLAAGSLLLAGCAPPPYAESDPPQEILLRWNGQPPGPPLPANTPPDSVTIRWDPARTTASDVDNIAEHHCLAWDEHAEQVRVEADGHRRLSTFVCKGPLMR
jgi:hypothetical protein